MRHGKLKRWAVVSMALVLVLGAAAQARAGPAKSARVLIGFVQPPGPGEQVLIRRAGGVIKHSYHLVPAIAASVPLEQLDSIASNPKVALVEEDVQVMVADQAVPWGVDRIDAELVHASNKGTGIKVAILDTGVDLDHPDLAVTGDISFVAGTTNGDDDHGHGTLVAGVLAALDNGLGTMGVAPEAALYAVKVLDQDGFGYISDIIRGMEWAVDNGIQVINMSLGSYLGWPVTAQEALDKAYQSGVILVAAAGNQGNADGEGDNILYPARYPSVMAVAATDSQDARASFSGTGPALELAAPGVAIPSTRPAGWATVSGTSLAAPHVAGCAALLIASGLTDNTQVRARLALTATDLGKTGRDNQYGYGLINAEAALRLPDSLDAAAFDLLPPDDLPPTTIIQPSGQLGDGGWFRSEVKVILPALDNKGGSGVAQTWYSLDQGSTWRAYQGPFLLSEEGVTQILARSVDKAQNEEDPPASREVKIDKTPPEVYIQASPELLWPPDKRWVEVSMVGSAWDKPPGSGLRSSWIMVEDEYGIIGPLVTPGDKGVFELQAWRTGADLDGRVYTVTLSATDVAGNQATAKTWVTVSHHPR